MANTTRRGRGEEGRTTVVVVVIEKDRIKIRTGTGCKKKAKRTTRRKPDIVADGVSLPNKTVRPFSESHGNRQKLWIKQVRRNVRNGITEIPPLPRLAEYRHITSQEEEKEVQNLYGWEMILYFKSINDIELM